MVFMKTGFVGVDEGGSHSSQNLPQANVFLPLPFFLINFLKIFYTVF